MDRNTAIGLAFSSNDWAFFICQGNGTKVVLETETIMFLDACLFVVFILTRKLM